MQVANRWITIGASIGLISCIVTAQQTTNSQALPLNSIIEALEKTQARTHPLVSYQVIREYQLSGAHDSRSDSDVVAELDFKPPTSKSYRIQKSLGSDRGQRVVRRVLDNEIESASTDNQSRTALSRDNYDFAYIGDVILDGQPCYLLGLKPKRKEKNLISGQVWVDQHSFLVRQIEGEVAKTPSWWLKKVSVKLKFSDFNGNWLQSSVEAVADVRVFGPHTLTSHVLDYRVAGEVASTTRVQSENRKQ
jgi:hypothetical protein